MKGYLSYVVGVLFAVNVALLFMLGSQQSDPPAQKHDVNASPFDIYQSLPIDLENATAVFGTVQAALKQRDSDINPVGVSFIPAYIPPNTRLYHARGDVNLPELFEWVAFDLEFSYNFERLNGFRRVETEYSEEDISGQLFSFRTTRALDKVIFLEGASAAKTSPKMDQQIILSNMTEYDSRRIDERKAAKDICDWGKKFGLQGYIRLEIGYEMVLCDFNKDVEIIANMSAAYANDMLGFPADQEKYVPGRRGGHPGGKPPPGGPGKPPGGPGKPPGGPGKPPGGPPGQEVFQGDQDVYPTKWPVKGDIPMDFSLAFNRSLLVSHLSYMADWEWVLAGGMRDNGEDRILLDWSHMVTPLNRTYVDPDPFKRNISYIPQNIRNSILDDIERVYQHPADPFRTTNWGPITGTIVKKFGPLLANLNTTLHKTETKNISDGLQLLTFNFARHYYDRNLGDWEAQRESAFNNSIVQYVYHTFPLLESDYRIYSSVFKVTHEIISLVFDAFDLSREISHEIYLESTGKTFDESIEALRRRTSDLVTLLNWAVFYRCNEACGIDAYCYTPTWGPGLFGWHGQGDEEFFYEDNGAEKVKKELRCVTYAEAFSNVPQL